MPRRYSSCVGTLVSLHHKLPMKHRHRHAPLLTRCWVQLHYPGDALPSYVYNNSGRHVHESVPVTVPRMNLRHVDKPRRRKTPKQHSDPCWLADMEALGQAAHADTTNGQQQQKPCAQPGAASAKVPDHSTGSEMTMP